MAQRLDCKSLVERLVELGDPYAALGACTVIKSPVLEGLALSSRRQKLVVAALPFAPEDVLYRLSLDADAPMMLRLAKNPATPREGLMRLLERRVTAKVRSYIASHPKADEVILSELAKDPALEVRQADRKSTRLNSSHVKISYAVFCLKKKTD